VRVVTLHPTNKLPSIVRSDERDKLLSERLTQDIEDGLLTRRPVDKVWIEARRQYAAIPKRPVRETPIPNAPNIEVPVGAILADDIYAQATDTLFTASPLLTVRSVNEAWIDHAKAFQGWVNWLVANELNLRDAANTAILDVTQLGTGFYYVPFVEETRKTKVHEVTHRHPRIFPMSPEDVILPSGSRGEIQRDRFVGLRFWYTKGELEERAKLRGWNIEGVQQTAQLDMVRMQHEARAGLRTGDQLWRLVYEIVEVYCYFDYDGDGLDEDLLVTFDRNSRKILAVQFNPYDTRPLEIARYQLRPHLPYGIGIMEMVQPFQEEVTELHCATILNVLLANARMWVANHNEIPETIEIYPSKVVKVNGDVNTALKELKMSEVYPSAFQAQTMGLSLAERRVGTSGQAGMAAKGGSRTPGVTALSLLQQVNRRFAPAFADMREATGGAVRQAVWRIAERVKSGDKQVSQHIIDVLGSEDGEMVLDILRTDDFERAIAIEFTASTASINREADRQNALLLVNMLGQYYMQSAALVEKAADPNTPESVRAVLAEIAKKGTEMMDRTIRTFEQVRDPRAFLVNATGMIEQAGAEAAAQVQAAVMQQLVAAQGGAGGMPGQPQAPPLPAPGFAGVA